MPFGESLKENQPPKMEDIPIANLKKDKLEESEDDRIKREIYEEVEKLRQERLKKEEETRRKRREEARAKKAVAAGSPSKPAHDAGNTEEVSERVLEARRKREQQQKEMKELRKKKMAQLANTAEPEIIVASPSRPSPHRPAQAESVAAFDIPKDNTQASARKLEFESAEAKKPQVKQEEQEDDDSEIDFAPPVKKPVEKVPIAKNQIKPGPDPVKEQKTINVVPENKEERAIKPQPVAAEQINWREKYEQEKKERENLQQVMKEYEKTVESLISKTPEPSTADTELIEAEKARLEAETESLTTVVSQLRQELQNYKNQNTSLKESVRILENEISGLRNELAKNDSGSAVKDAEAIIKLKQATTKEITVLKARLHMGESEIASLKASLAAKEREHAELTQISESLLQMIESK